MGFGSLGSILSPNGHTASGQAKQLDLFGKVRPVLGPELCTQLLGEWVVRWNRFDGSNEVGDCQFRLCQFVHDEVAHRREVDRFDGSSLGKGCECFEEPLLVELYALAQVVRENQGRSEEHTSELQSLMRIS